MFFCFLIIRIYLQNTLKCKTVLIFLGDFYHFVTFLNEYFFIMQVFKKEILFNGFFQVSCKRRKAWCDCRSCEKWPSDLWATDARGHFSITPAAMDDVSKSSRQPCTAKHCVKLLRRNALCSPTWFPFIGAQLIKVSGFFWHTFNSFFFNFKWFLCFIRKVFFIFSLILDPLDIFKWMWKRWAMSAGDEGEHFSRETGATSSGDSLDDH